MSNLYLLFACDRLKNKNTMRLLVATDEETDIRIEILKNIDNGRMQYSKGTKDLNFKNLMQLNNHLENGYIQVES